DLTKYFLNNYLNKLTRDGLSKNTQKLHLTVVKSFLYFIADSDLEKFGFLKLKLDGIKIKTEQKEKDSFAQNEQAKLLNYLITLDAKKSYLAQRNSLLIKILLHTGVRISELINIKWSGIAEHYDDKHGYIYVILVYGKGNKERFTYLQHDEVKDNLEFLKLNRLTDSPYLFLSTHGNQCNRSSLFDVVKTLLQQAGIHKSGLHIFRHTFARSLVDRDVNLATIKDLLGHSNIAVTAQFYAKSNENAKRNALFKG
ncbi:MAG: tyrosine-type recombinase/integrase, partial [Rhodospirillales bacterium]|nr:tyrosine-type recombinase/integrase [Rhodospirillales bacterium]